MQVNLFKLVVASSNRLCYVLQLLLINLSEKIYAKVSPLRVQQPGNPLQKLTMVLLQ